MPGIDEPVPLFLDRQRYLRFDALALFEAEREISKLWGKEMSLFNVLASSDGLGINNLSVLLWQALLWEDGTLTLRQVQTMMDFTRLGEIIGAVLEAWNRHTAPADPSAQGGTSENGPLASESPGTSFGPMAASSFA